MRTIAAKNFDLPREKIVNLGAQALKDEELLAVLLATGIKGCDVFELSKQVLKLVDQKNGNLAVNDLLSIRGLGQAQACKILAALEFSRRRIMSDKYKIKEAANVFALLQHLSFRKQECFVCISLNGAHEVIEARTITVGLVNFCQVHPREVYADVITDRACALIIAHNHPSGNLEPSQADREVTKRIKSAGEILGIELLDHVIIGSTTFFSFKEAGLL